MLKKWGLVPTSPPYRLNDFYVFLQPVGVVEAILDRPHIFLDFSSHFQIQNQS
jgi:hypothetical protein